VTAGKLYKQFGVITTSDFEDKLDEIKNSEFNRLVKEFKLFKGGMGGRVSREIALQLTYPVVEYLSHLGVDVGYAGSMRRGLDTVRDVDVIVCLKGDVDLQFIRQALAKMGLHPNTRNGSVKWGILIDAKKQPNPDEGYPSHLSLDLNFCTETNRGAYYNYLTGCKELNIKIREYAITKNKKVNEHGILDAQGRKIGGEKEEDMWNLLNLNYLKPQERNPGFKVMTKNGQEAFVI